MHLTQTTLKDYAKEASDDLWFLNPDSSDRLLVLKIYADDSFGRHEPGFEGVCVVAGYMAAPSTWANVTLDWRAALKSPPEIQYFRMHEFIQESGEFAGLLHNQKQDKFDSLIAVLRKHSTELTWLESAITWDEYDHGLSERMRLVFRTPVYFCLAGIVLASLGALVLLASPRGPLRHFNSAHPKLLILR
ncbi:MAG: hypothetical protein LAP38_27090 [Acidobacteriia bacterium]|nr:hypothetical protein [Terriglobia bacterium]